MTTMEIYGTEEAAISGFDYTDTVWRNTQMLFLVFQWDLPAMIKTKEYYQTYSLKSLLKIPL